LTEFERKNEGGTKKILLILPINRKPKTKPDELAGIQYLDGNWIRFLEHLARSMSVSLSTKGTGMGTVLLVCRKICDIFHAS
jgi:hypothetical protein